MLTLADCQQSVPPASCLSNVNFPYSGGGGACRVWTWRCNESCRSQAPRTSGRLVRVTEPKAGFFFPFFFFFQRNASTRLFASASSSTPCHPASPFPFLHQRMVHFTPCCRSFLYCRHFFFIVILFLLLVSFLPSFRWGKGPLSKLVNLLIFFSSVHCFFQWPPRTLFSFIYLFVSFSLVLCVLTYLLHYHSHSLLQPNGHIARNFPFSIFSVLHQFFVRRGVRNKRDTSQ